MKILHRYMLMNFLAPLFFCTVLFFSMFIFVDGFNNLEDFMKSGTSARLFAAYYATLFPLVIHQILPAASLLAALFFIGQMNRHHEISAMKAAGVSNLEILRPVLLAGLILSIAVFAINERVAPGAAAVSAAIKRGLADAAEGPSTSRALSNVTLLTHGDKMVYARELALDAGSLHDVIVLEQNPDLTLRSKTTARKGVWSERGWIFYDVVHYALDGRGDVKGRPLTLETMDSGILEGPMDFIQQDTEMQFMNTKRLRRHIENTRKTGFRTSDRVRVELHHKSASPFASFVILLVGAPAAIRLRRGGTLVNLGMGLFIVAAYYLAIAVSLALGNGGIFPAAVAAWLPHVAFLALGAALLRKYA